MHATWYVPFVVALSIVVSMTSSGLAARASAVQSSSAPVESRHDRAAPRGERDQHGPLVTLRVRALVPAKVTLSDLAPGTVRATVLAIDEESNQIKVQTEEGQRLMLFLAPASLARLQVGAPCLLQVAPQSMWESTRPPAHEETFW